MASRDRSSGLHPPEAAARKEAAVQRATGEVELNDPVVADLPHAEQQAASPGPQ